MSISTENSKDLESYGVWVKNSSNDEQINNTENKNEQDSFDLPEDTLNQEEMPDITDDFDNMDFSDMFKDDSQFSSEQKSDVSEDTTLTTDELANISSEIQDFEEPVEEVTEDSIDDTKIEDIDLPNMDNIETPTENSNEEEEVSLDDFFDGGGFSDESVASGNNGMEVKPEDSNTTEEVSLDDFFDADSFDSPSKQEEELPDEKPLNMDISFDDSKAFETVDNDSLKDDDDISFDDEPDTASEASSSNTETIAINDFDFGELDTNASESSSILSKKPSDEVLPDTESVDLSDFGIDANAEETPVVQNVEEAKNKEKVVDYNLSVSDDVTSAPTVNIVKEKSTEETEEIKPQEESETVSSSLLQQIINDLSGLKNEINVLKHNLEEIKQSDNSVLEKTEEIELPKEESDGGFFGNDDTDDTIALSGDELDNIMTTATIEETPSIDDHSFVENTIEDTPTTEDVSIDDSFATEEETLSDKDDEIIENSDLEYDFSNDNLEEPNINEINTTTEEDLPAEISIPKDNDILVESSDDDFMSSINDTTPSTDSLNTFEEPTVDDTIVEEPAIEETITEEVEMPSVDDVIAEEPVIEEPVVEETIVDEVEVPSVDDVVAEEPVIEEPVEEETIVDEEVEMPSVDDVIADEPVIEDDTLSVSEIDNIVSSADIDEPNFTNVENVFDSENVIEEPTEEETITEEEVEVPTVDDVIADEPVIEEPAIEETIVDEEVEVPSVDDVIAEEPVIEEPVVEESITEEETEVPTVDDVVAEEPVIEEPAIEETIVDEEVEVPTVDDVVAEEPFVDNSFVDVNSDNNLTNDNINYLTKEEPSTENVDSNTSLKQDIKSVLLYMDQLLGKLPEDKIIEFAKSDEFTTYKKLFKELGLS